MDFNGALTTIFTGSIGVSPGTSISGSYLVEKGSEELNTAAAVNCASDQLIAFEYLNSRPCTNVRATEDLAGLTLLPGVYCSQSGSFSITSSSLTLDAQGDQNAKFIFQTDTTVTTATQTSFILINGANNKNVYWKVGTAMTLGLSSSFIGNVLAKTSISVGTSTAVVGRLLAQAGVTFAGSGDMRLPGAMPSSSPAPLVVSGPDMDELGLTITVEFNVNTNRAGLTSEFDCLALLFSDVGNAADIFNGCVWIDRKTLEIDLRPAQQDIDEFGSTLHVDGNITIRGGMITRNDGSASIPETILRVKQPIINDIRFGVIFETVLAQCADFEVEVSSPLGATRGDALKWNWNLISGYRNDVNITNENEVNDFRAALDIASANDETEILIPEALIPKAVEYSISVTASDRLGRSFSRLIIFTVEGSQAPSIRFSRRPDNDEISLSGLAQYRTSTVIQECIGDANSSSTSNFDFQFVWLIQEPTNTIETQLSIANFLLADPRRLRIDGKSLIPFVDSYTIQYTITATSRVGGETLESTRSIPLTVKPSEVVASIRGGDRSVGSLSDLTLDASESKSTVEDLEITPANWSLTKDFTWTCAVVGAETDCTSKLLAETSTQASQKILSLNLASLRNELNNPAELQITFHVDVEFSLTRDDDDVFTSTDTSEVMITLLEGDVPDVRLESITPKDTPTITIGESRFFKVNQESDLRLQAAVETHEDATATIVGWEVVEGDIDNLEDVVDGDITSTTLVITGGLLTRGGRYRFRFRSSFEGSAIFGFTEVGIMVNRPPRGGSLEVYRLGENGGIGRVIALEENVTSDSEQIWLRAEQWIDNDSPLTYQYYYSFTENIEDSVLLGVAASSRRIRTTVPTPSDDTDTVWVLAKIFDSLGASIVVSRTVHIIKPGVEALSQFVGLQLETGNVCLQTKDTTCVARSANAGIRTSNLLGPSEDRLRLLEAEESIVDQMVTLLQESMTFYVNDIDQASFYLDALKASSVGFGLSTSNSLEIMVLTNQVLNTNLDILETQFRYSDNLARRVVTIVSNLLVAIGSGDVAGTDELFGNLTTVSVKVSRCVLLGRDAGAGTRTIQASFNDIEVFCDQASDVGIFTRLVTLGQSSNVIPGALHGIGLSDFEFENCGTDEQRDTRNEGRVKPHILLQENIDNGDTTDVIIVVEEFVRPPFVVDQSAAIVTAAKGSTTASTLVEKLKDFIANSLLPDGNLLDEDGLNVGNLSSTDNRFLRSSNLKWNIRSLSEIVDGSLSNSEFSRSVASKSLRVQAYDRDGNSQTTSQNVEVAMVVFPDENLDLTQVMTVADIVDGKVPYPSQIFTCPEEGGSVAVDCDDPFSAETNTIDIHCGASMSENHVEFFCPTKLLMPVVLLFDELEGNWHDTTIGFDGISFDSSRVISANSSDLGLFTSSLLFVDMEMAARILPPTPTAFPKATAPAKQVPVDQDSSSSGGLSSGIIALISLSVIAMLSIAIVSTVLYLRLKRKKTPHEESLASADHEAESIVPIIDREEGGE